MSLHIWGFVAKPPLRSKLVRIITEQMLITVHSVGVHPHSDASREELPCYLSSTRGDLPW